MTGPSRAERLAEIKAKVSQFDECEGMGDGKDHYGDSGPYCGGCEGRAYDLAETDVPWLLEEIARQERLLNAWGEEWQAQHP